MKNTVIVNTPAELNSLTPAQRLENLGYERSESKDSRGKKVTIYSKDGIDYLFRGALPINESGSAIELTFEG